VEGNYGRDRNCPQPVEARHVTLSTSERLRHALPFYCRLAAGGTSRR
jgi:hypothetical protein